jgi:LPXTG-motif cell wall-anchored protein
VRSLVRAVRAIAVTGAVAGLTVLGMPAPAHADPAPVSFFAGSDTPVNANWNDEGSLELGVRFHSDVAGSVTAVRFYKGDKNTGTHTGTLWTATGEQLATATFADESGSGWQQVSFDEPVAVEAGVTYVASYHTSVGFYSADVNAFAGNGLDKGALHIPADGGSFRSGAGFPNELSPHNYWVDIVFQEKKAAEPTPTETVEPTPTETVEPTPTGTVQPTATAAPPAEGGGLPVTGANGPVLAGGGLLLAAVGVLLVWRHRRRATRFVA